MPLLNFLKRTAFLILLFMPMLLPAQDEITLKGTVTEAGTGEPLAGVHVYISNTIEGATTDSVGRYSFKTRLRGKNLLVASFIGFQSREELIYLLDDPLIETDFELDPSIFDMDEIVVESEFDEEWYDNFRSFKEFFIGTDDFAREVEILNQHVLEFKSDGSGKKVEAFNKAPLQILNNALGYYIEVELQDVVFDPSTNSGYYVVNSRFEEMESESRSERRSWRRNRTIAYEGSSRHFFQSLNADRIRRNKFDILPKNTAIERIEDDNRLRRAYPGNWEFMKENYTTYLINHPQLSIGHDLERDRGGRIMDPGELSTMYTKNRSNVFSVNSLGLLYKPENVQFGGNWSRDRFSVSLPIGYPN